MKRPILVNDARELMQENLRLDARIKADTERKKAAMEELAILMQEKGVAYDGKREKSTFVYATIQEDKKIKYTIFRETLNKGGNRLEKVRHGDWRHRGGCRTFPPSLASGSRCPLCQHLRP